jgi:exodeoxyribonuclease VII large subunit
LSRWHLHDVVILARGGGSLEDLWAFNEEIVVRAIAASPIPVISGVGHETDFTIADFVADLRAPTPSAAAEIVIRAKSEICNQIDAAVHQIRHLIEGRARARRHALERSRVALYRMLDLQAKRLRRRLALCDEPLAKFPSRVERARHRLASLSGHLEAVSPLSVLSRGYAIAFSRTRKRKKPILDSTAVSIGDRIEVQLKKGALQCSVDAKTLGIESVWPTSNGK